MESGFLKEIDCGELQSIKKFEHKILATAQEKDDKQLLYKERDDEFTYDCAILQVNNLWKLFARNYKILLFAKPKKLEFNLDSVHHIHNNLVGIITFPCKNKLEFYTWTQRQVKFLFILNEATSTANLSKRSSYFLYKN
jgi:hypothetical protein